ncbi:MAG: hypothetical protein JXB32_20090 [Deltaproteobacteria bacterium]|nr:hypothetical protein [Deltaproteobacteria bacterium]
MRWTMTQRAPWLLPCTALLLSACAPGDDGEPPRDVVRDDADVEEAWTGALVPAAPPVEVHVSSDHVLGPVLLTSLSGSAAVIWGERDTEAADWGGPGVAMLDAAGALSFDPVHLPDNGHEPVGLEPLTAVRQLAYFTMQRGTGCEATLHRRTIDTAGRIMGATATVDTLDDPVAVHVASVSGFSLVLAVEGDACTAREFPAARTIVVGADGTATGEVPLGEAYRISALAAKPDGSGYVAMRYVDGDGVRLDELGLGGGAGRGWTIVRRDGTRDGSSATSALAAGGTDYLVAWAGQVDGEQSWYLHRGPYGDDLEFGAEPAVLAFGARFDRRAAAAAFGADYVVAYVPTTGAPLRIDLLRAGTLEEGWSPDLDGEVTWVAAAAIGAQVAVAWVEKWAGAAAPSILRAGLFQRN